MKKNRLSLNELREYLYAAQQSNSFSVFCKALYEFGLICVEKGQLALALDAFYNCFTYARRKNIRFYNQKKFYFQVDEALLQSRYIRPFLQPPKTYSKTQFSRTELHILPMIIDDYNSPTKIVQQLVQQSKPDTQIIIVCTNTSAKQYASPLGIEAFASASSQKQGKKTITDWENYHVTVFCTDTNLDWWQNTRLLLKNLRQFQIDIAYFHTYCTDMIARLLCLAKVARFQIDITHNSAMISRYVDAITDFVKATYLYQKSQWRKLNIPYYLIPLGVDLPHPSQDRLMRAKLGIPQHALVLVSTGNYLPRILTPAFIAHVCQLLKTYAHVRYLLIGDGDFIEQHILFSQYCVDTQVIYAGSQPHAALYTALGDIFLNPFPKGQALAVIESMGMGVAAVCMQYGSGHVENIGATFIGKDAIKGNDLRLYFNRVIQLIEDPVILKKTKINHQKRARTLFTIASMKEALLRIEQQLQ